MERLYLKPSLCKDIYEYCKMNGIEDINAFANRCAIQGFNIVKYGLSPKDNIERETKGIKDNKDVKTRKKKELVPTNEGEQEQSPKSDGGKKEKEIKPAEKGKEVIVRKIQIIKKDKKND